MSLDYLEKIRERARWYHDSVLLEASMEFERLKTTAEGAEARVRQAGEAVASARAARDKLMQENKQLREKIAGLELQLEDLEELADPGDPL